MYKELINRMLNGNKLIGFDRMNSIFKLEGAVWNLISPIYLNPYFDIQHKTVISENKSQDQLIYIYIYIYIYSQKYLRENLICKLCL